MKQQALPTNLLYAANRRRVGMVMFCLLMVFVLVAAFVLDVRFVRLLIVGAVLVCPLILLLWTIVERRSGSATSRSTESQKRENPSR